ncbi:MAG: flagellar hook-basal body complex protein FliE [Armatimonadota bacterium]|nr:flagellar hook-basal body complex protein FliE [Armatimonadota bacterium]
MNLLSLPTASLGSSTGLTNAATSLLGPDTNSTGSTGGPSFAQTLQSAFGQVNALQDHSTQMTQAFAQGKVSDVHSVMIASEQATMALQLTTQIRNKAIDAYQEIMRISM